MKSSNSVRSVLVFIPFFALAVACGNTQFEQASIKEPRPQPPPTAVPSSNGNASPKADALKPWDFSIKSVAQSGVKEDVFEYLFLVDDSVSMKPHITKLQASLGSFVDSMNEEKVKFRLRLLPFSSLVQQLQKDGVKVGNETSTLSYYRPGGIDAGLSSGMLAPNYDRGSLADLYRNSVVLGNESTAAEVNAGLSSVLKSGAEIENEPGVCLAMDFLLWQKALGLPSGKQLHIVALSTEDNSRRFDQFARGAASRTPIASDTLFCAGKGEIAKSCTNPTHVWKKKLPDTTEHRYEVTYTSNPCAVGSTEPIYDINEKGTCRLEQARYKCSEKAATVYSCSASGQTSPINNKNLQGEGVQRCQAAAKFECEIFVDNFPSKVVYDRSTALAKMKENVSCRPLSAAESGQADVAFDFSSQELLQRDALGVRACSVYACTASTPLKTTGGLTAAQISDTKYSNCQDDTPFVSFTSPWSKSSGSWTKSECAQVRPGSVPFGRVSKLEGNVCASKAPAVHADLERIGKGNAADTTQKRTLGGYVTPLAQGQEAAALRTRFENEVTDRAKNAYVSWKALAPVQKAGGYEWKENATSAASPGAGWELDRVEKCEGLATSETGLLTPTPENFQALAKEAFAGVQITWHAIVSQDDQTCAGASGLQTEGKDYVALAKATGGFVQNVCEPDFSTFIDKLARFSLQVPVLRYPLPEGFSKIPSEKWTVSVGGKPLEAKDFRVEAEALVFAAGAVKTGDAIKVEAKD